MAAAKTEKDRKPGIEKAEERPEKATSARRAISVDDPDFLDQISKQLSNSRPADADKNILLNIPIWGWTGDGKTCALITAIHFCDPALHPLGFSPVSNHDEFTALETSAEEYRGLNLSATALATTDRFRALSEIFIDKNEWPPGTDEPSAYVLAIRSVDSTLGYVLFPDIKGGSFRELDETAREVLRKAHAAVLLVNPELYDKKTTDGKRYRDEILARLQKFGEAQVPVCVMITKADLHQGPNQATDITHKSLTVIVERQKNLQALVCRVSVVGLEKDLSENKLPPISERNPDTLIKAWIWVVSQALCRPAKQIRNLLPSINIRAVAARPSPISVETIAELRHTGDFSNSPGIVLCSSSDDPRNHSFAFLSGDGTLFETSATLGGTDDPQFRPLGKLSDWEGTPTEMQGFYTGGEFLVGNLGQCNFIWQGTKGGSLSKISLPFEIVSWVAASSRRLIGLDASGRLHSFRQEGGKWTQVDYVAGFIPPSDFLTCALVDSSSHVFAYNGTTVAGITLGNEGRFAARVSTPLICKYDTTETATNRLGLCVAITDEGEAVASGPGKTVQLGPINADARVAAAVAPYAPIIALTGPDLRLSVAIVTGTEVRSSTASYSPELHAIPESMAWSRNGELLIATFADSTWGVYRSLGLLE